MVNCVGVCAVACVRSALHLQRSTNCTGVTKLLTSTCFQLCVFRLIIIGSKRAKPNRDRAMDTFRHYEGEDVAKFFGYCSSLGVWGLGQCQASIDKWEKKVARSKELEEKIALFERKIEQIKVRKSCGCWSCHPHASVRVWCANVSSDLSFQQEQNVSGWMDEDLVLYGVSSSKELPAQLKQMKEELEQLKKVRKREKTLVLLVLLDVPSVCSRSCLFFYCRVDCFNVASDPFVVTGDRGRRCQTEVEWRAESPAREENQT